MLGAEKPMITPNIASFRWDLAFSFPVINENAANTSPSIATSGKIVDVSLLCIALSVDSTLQKPKVGSNAIAANIKIDLRCFLFILVISFIGILVSVFR